VLKATALVVLKRSMSLRFQQRMCATKSASHPSPRTLFYVSSIHRPAHARGSAVPARTFLATRAADIFERFIFSFPLLLEQKWSKIQGGTHAISALLKNLEKQSG
jgi:hypothetical protein